MIGAPTETGHHHHQQQHLSPTPFYLVDKSNNCFCIFISISLNSLYASSLISKSPPRLIVLLHSSVYDRKEPSSSFTETFYKFHRILIKQNMLLQQWHWNITSHISNNLLFSSSESSCGWSEVAEKRLHLLERATASMPRAHTRAGTAFLAGPRPGVGQPKVPLLTPDQIFGSLHSSLAGPSLKCTCIRGRPRRSNVICQTLAARAYMGL